MTWPVTALNVAVGDIVKAGDVLAVADDTTAELAVAPPRRTSPRRRPRRRSTSRAAPSRRAQQAKDQVTSASTQLANARASYGSHRRPEQPLAAGGPSRRSPPRATSTRTDTRAKAPAQTLRQDRQAITTGRAEPRVARAPGRRAATARRRARSRARSSRSPPRSAATRYATSSADDATLVVRRGRDHQRRERRRGREGRPRRGDDHGAHRRSRDGGRTSPSATESTGTAIELQSTQLAHERERRRVRHPEPQGRPGGDRRDQRHRRHRERQGHLDRPGRDLARAAPRAVTYTVVVTLDDTAGATASTPGATGADRHRHDDGRRGVGRAHGLDRDRVPAAARACPPRSRS